MYHVLAAGADIGIVDVGFGEVHFDAAEAHINWDAVYRRIRETAMELGVDLHDIAEFLGLNPLEADYMEKYRALPKMQTAMQVAAFLGVPAAYVLAGKGRPKHHLVNAIRQGISDTADSTVVQGNSAGTLIINNGAQQMTEHQRELMRIFNALPLKKQVLLLTRAYELEDGNTTS